MSVIALKQFGLDFPLVLINNKEKTGFCGFNINLNMPFDKDKSYEVFRDELQVKFKEILTFVKENQSLREHFTDEGCINLPEGTNVPVELIRIEGISFTKDTGEDPGTLMTADFHVSTGTNAEVSADAQVLSMSL